MTHRMKAQARPEVARVAEVIRRALERLGDEKPSRVYTSDGYEIWLLSVALDCCKAVVAETPEEGA